MGQEPETFQSMLPNLELEAEQQLELRRGPGRPPREVWGKKAKVLSLNPSSVTFTYMTSGKSLDLSVLQLLQL